jgi:metal-responsive CopG/Arc/MetJ family transcriptional regulator
MRTTDTMTISLPPAMAKQMEKVQKEEHRTRSELLREAWRQYFESRYGVATTTQSELHAELDARSSQPRPKRPRKAS